MGRLADLEEMAMADLIAFLQRLYESNTELVAQVRGMAINDVLVTETLALDANGVAERDWNVPLGSVTVDNYGSAALTVAGATPQGNAPPVGVGVGKIAPGFFRTFNITGTSVSFYGNPNELLRVEAFTKPQPPAGGLCGRPGALNEAIVRQTGNTTRQIPAGRRSRSLYVVAAASAASPTYNGVALPIGTRITAGVDTGGDTLPAATLITVAGDDVIYLETY